MLFITANHEITNSVHTHIHSVTLVCLLDTMVTLFVKFNTGELAETIFFHRRIVANIDRCMMIPKGQHHCYGTLKRKSYTTLRTFYEKAHKRSLYASIDK